MTDTPPTDRKICPHCGHPNRASAKICTQCGRPLERAAMMTNLPRKTCPVCGHENSPRAKVCSQCGTPFPTVKVVKTSVIGGVQKWCPQCGAPRRPGAKVCSKCGYRFSGVPLTGPIVQPNPPAVTLPKDIRPQPPVNIPPALDGEPAPYISSDDLDRIRGGGVYHPNVFIRMLSRVNKKSP